MIEEMRNINEAVRVDIILFIYMIYTILFTQLISTRIGRKTGYLSNLLAVLTQDFLTLIFLSI